MTPADARGNFRASHVRDLRWLRATDQLCLLALGKGALARLNVFSKSAGYFSLAPHAEATDLWRPEAVGRTNKEADGRRPLFSFWLRHRWSRPSAQSRARN